MDAHILSREERIRESREFNLLSDVFLSVALDDVPACQHIIRILTGIGDLMVKQVRTQYVIAKINSRTVRLDVLAEDSEGKLYQIEIQRQDTVDHPRRVCYMAHWQTASSWQREESIMSCRTGCSFTSARRISGKKERQFIP